MMRSLVSLGVALSGAIVLLSSPALACTCMVPPVETARDDASAVFEGRVLSIEQTDNSPATNGELSVTLSVVRTWKGLSNEERVTIVTNGSSAACGYTFAPRSSYLVYARASGDQKLHVSGCGRTKSVEGSAEDLRVLGAGSTPVTIEKIRPTSLDAGTPLGSVGYTDGGDGNLPPVLPASATPTAAGARQRGCAIGPPGATDTSPGLLLGMMALGSLCRRRAARARRQHADCGQDG